MLGNIEVKWIYDVLALEELRSFTLAAERRNISQSSFSRRVQALESTVGFEIFKRGSTPLLLTSEGKSFIVYARNLIDDMDFQINNIKGVNSIRQRINIAAAHSLAVFVLPEFISEFSGKKDNIFFVESINVDEAVYNLKEGRCDFILSFSNEELMSFPFLHHEVFQTQLHLVSPCHLNGEPIYNVGDKNIPLMKYADESYMGRQVNQLLTRESELSFSLSFVSSMSDVLKMMIMRGNGVGWLPDYSIAQEMESGSLSVMDPSLSIRMSVYVYRTSARLNLSSERFWQQMKLRTSLF